ncbi:hypothetical protein ANAPRD1_00295 [Anaplasma phagocytophilum]|nr:hypothetical protein ANAPRD1_00295 [Anaplasma phagocytophilum]
MVQHFTLSNSIVFERGIKNKPIVLINYLLKIFTNTLQSIMFTMF